MYLTDMTKTSLKIKLNDNIEQPCNRYKRFELATPKKRIY